RLDRMEKAEVKADGGVAVAEVLAEVSKDRLRAARMALALVERRPDDAEALMAAARRLIFTKGTNAHDYKFSSAAVEDFYKLAPRWGPSSPPPGMFSLRGAGDRDNDLVRRPRDALAGS